LAAEWSSVGAREHGRQTEQREEAPVPMRYN
jgi:hypothetical protein